MYIQPIFGDPSITRIWISERTKKQCHQSSGCPSFVRRSSLRQLSLKQPMKNDLPAIMSGSTMRKILYGERKMENISGHSMAGPTPFLPWSIRASEKKSKIA